MVRVHIFCEGQTEETFVREVLQAHLNRHDVYLNPIILRTSATARGGVTSYAKMRWQIEKKCKEDQSAYVTSLVDLYGLPSDFPNKTLVDAQSDPHNKIAIAEKAFKESVGQKNFIPSLLLHEYEALLLSDVSKFETWFPAEAVNKLFNDIRDAATPEHVNDNPTSAPSKRILRYCAGYDKPLHGSLIAIDIGLDTIRHRCSHFNNWLTGIERLT